MTNITIKIPLDLQLQMALLGQQRPPLPHNHPVSQPKTPLHPAPLPNIALFHSGGQIHVLQIDGHHVQQTPLASPVLYGTYRARIAGKFETVRDHQPTEIGDQNVGRSRTHGEENYGRNGLQVEGETQRLVAFLQRKMFLIYLNSIKNYLLRTVCPLVAALRLVITACSCVKCFKKA